MSATDRVFLPVVQLERNVASLGQSVQFFVFGNEVTCGILIPIGPLFKRSRNTTKHVLCEMLDEEFVEEFSEIIAVYFEYLDEIGYIKHDDPDYLGEIETEDGAVRCELLHLSGVASGSPGAITFNGEYYFIASAETEIEDFLPLVTVCGTA